MSYKELALSKVILKEYVLVADSDLEAVKRELESHIRLTRQEDGCIVFDVSQDSENKNRFNVYEEFSSQEAFELHQQRAGSTEWGKVSSKLEKHYKTTNLT